MKKFQSTANASEPIEFAIDDIEFTFRAPKRSGLVLAALSDNANGTTASLEWITKGLSREHYKAPKDSPCGRGENEDCQACTLLRILLDEDSAFDLADLGEVFSWLMEEVTARPSGKPSD